MDFQQIMTLLPGKNCGICGMDSCEAFARKVETDPALLRRCIHISGDTVPLRTTSAKYGDVDVNGQSYDYVLIPLPGEPSCREYIRPFNPILAEKLNLQKDDILVGRPRGQGCPVQHVMRIIHCDIDGVLTVWTIGPQFSRDREFKEIGGYDVIGFEGLAENIKQPPTFGIRQCFLPGFCMMNLNHTGLVNFVHRMSHGTQVRLEDIIIGV